MPAIRIVAGDRRPTPPAGLCSLDALRAISPGGAYVDTSLFQPLSPLIIATVGSARSAHRTLETNAAFPLASQTRAEPYQCHQWWVGQPSIAPV